MSILSRLLPKKELDEYFLILSVEDNLIRAIISHLIKDKVVVIGSGESEYISGTDETEAADIAISTAEKNLPENILVEKVIFVLPTEYVDDVKIKPEYLSLLKKITKDLQLKPQGFIEYTESIAYFLEKEDGSPPTTILVAVNKKNLSFTLIRVGKIHQSFYVPRTESVVDDLEKILPKFESEILPSSLILYDEFEDLGKLREEFLKFSWNKHPEFLHTPKIKILTKNELITAFVEAASSGIRKDLKIDFITTALDKEDNNHEVDRPLPVDSSRPEITAQASNQPLPEEPAESPITDTTNNQNEVTEEEPFGFIKGKDILNLKKEHANIKIPAVSKPLMIDEEVSEADSEEKIAKKREPFKLPVIRLPNFSGWKNIHIPFFVPAILVLISTAFGFWFILSYPKVEIDLRVLPKISSNVISINFTLDALSNNTPGNNNLVAREISLEATGEKTAVTTGKTSVGDRTKGTVVVYNKTLTSKTLPKGTLLKNGNLNFTLDEDIQIASSSDTGEGLAYGKTNSKITAQNIGTESNLTSGSIFTFKDFPESSFTAKNEQNLTGGTSREVASVSKEDVSQLENSLISELTSKIKQDLIKSLKTGEKLIDSSINISTVSKKLSHEVGSESKELSINLTLKITALVFNEIDLKEISQENIASVPLGYVIDPNRTGIKIVNIKKDGKGMLTADANITSYYLPEIDKNTLVKNLSGKSYLEASEYLKNLNLIAGVKFIPLAQIPFLKNKLPFIAKNISINVIPF